MTVLEELGLLVFAYMLICKTCERSLVEWLNRLQIKPQRAFRVLQISEHHQRGPNGINKSMLLSIRDLVSCRTIMLPLTGIGLYMYRWKASSGYCFHCERRSMCYRHGIVLKMMQ